MFQYVLHVENVVWSLWILCGCVRCYCECYREEVSEWIIDKHMGVGGGVCVFRWIHKLSKRQ